MSGLSESMIIALSSAATVEVSPNGATVFSRKLSVVFLLVPADSVAERPAVTDGLASTSGPTGTTKPELAELLEGSVEVSPNGVPVSG